EAVDGAFDNQTIPVAGPSDWTFLEMVRAIRGAVNSRAVIVSAPAYVALAGLWAAGLMLHDVVLTADEVKGLTREYLYVERPLRRGIDFGSWVSDRAVAS